MISAESELRSVIVEREMPHPPEKIWRALTQPELVKEWLMETDLEPSVGHRFGFRADWGAVDCEVLDVEPGKTLTYRWASHGLESVVTWTLTPSGNGTRLRLVQSGFGPDQKQAYHGATAGWPRFLAAMEQLLARTP